MSTNKNGSVVQAALLLAVASLGSRIVGLIRERVLTTAFGAGDTFDAFVAAFRLPDLIFNLVVIGALSAAFIPLFTDKLVKHNGEKKPAFDFAVSLLNILLLVVAVFSIVYAILAPWIVPLITPGFTGEKLELTIRLARIMTWQPLLLTASFIFSGILNSFKRFLSYALAPILYNIGIIFGVLVLVPWIGILGLGWGVVVGAALHLAVQFPGVWQAGFRWWPAINWRDSDWRTVIKLVIPRMIGLGAEQMNLLLVTIVGSTLLAGSITVFYLANNIQFLPIGIFGLGFAQAAFPALSEYAARRDAESFKRTLTRSFRHILFFVIPLMVFFFLLRAQLVRVLFGDGAFDWEDTILTFETLSWLIVSVFAQATIPLLTRAFYARQDTRTPVIFSLSALVVNVVLALVLSRFFGVQGLAMAFSVAAILHFGLLLGALHWQLGGFDDREVLHSLWRIAVAAALAGVAVQVVKYPLAAIVDMTRFWGVFLQLAGAGIGGVLMYIGVCWFLNSEELVAVKKYLPRRFRALPVSTETL